MKWYYDIESLIKRACAHECDSDLI
jgi:hypothetical protein